MSAPQGFNPSVSLLPTNPSAPIVPFQGGGGSIQPFYQAIIAGLPEERRKDLPKQVQILKFTTSVKDGNFVLTLRIKGKEEEEEESNAEILKKGREFLQNSEANNSEEGIDNSEIREEPVEDTPAEDLNNPLNIMERQYQNLGESYDLPVEQEPNPEENAIGLRVVARATDTLQRARSLLSASSAFRAAGIGRGVSESKSRSPSPENTRREAIAGVTLTDEALASDSSTRANKVFASQSINATPLNRKSRLQLQQSNNGRVAFGALKASQKPQRRPLSY